MKIKFFPRTISGSWGAIFSITFVVLILLKFQMAIPLTTAMISALGAAGFIAGSYAVMQKDKSLLVIFSIIVGIVLVIWAGAELLFPGFSSIKLY